MMVDLKVMAYFKISLSTRNWDRAIKNGDHLVAVFFIQPVRAAPPTCSIMD
ncbi:hypothetical protein [Aeromonas veronii]|uniref:hypothetical protein n=1 Tax=Aeromonas veronii TaxID=654 RepID=UPI00301D6218